MSERAVFLFTERKEVDEYQEVRFSEKAPMSAVALVSGGTSDSGKKECCCLATLIRISHSETSIGSRLSLGVPCPLERSCIIAPVENWGG